MPGMSGASEVLGISSSLELGGEGERAEELDDESWSEGGSTAIDGTSGMVTADVDVCASSFWGCALVWGDGTMTLGAGGPGEADVDWSAAVERVLGLVVLPPEARALLELALVDCSLEGGAKDVLTNWTAFSMSPNIVS